MVFTQSHMGQVRFFPQAEPMLNLLVSLAVNIIFYSQGLYEVRKIEKKRDMDILGVCMHPAMLVVLIVD